MTRLVAPDVARCDAWAAMLADFGDDYPHGSGAEPGSSYAPEDCAAFVAERLAFAAEETLPRADWVTCSHYWIADGDDDLVGFLALVEARDLGLDRVLVTCEEDNVASRRTIESAGGVLEDVRAGKRRYWVETSSGR